MTARDRGFLLLTGHLGDPEEKPLTVAQFRDLTRQARRMDRPAADRELTEQDLICMGFSREYARRILRLLDRQEQLDWYLKKGAGSGCVPITRGSRLYPGAVRTRLALEAPGCLWAKGDVSILRRPAVCLVGSRDLRADNLAFAREVGRQAALQGYTLVSGNARGADRAAQDSCRAHGGWVISVVADSLEKQTAGPQVLYLAEEGFDLPFSSARALSRNRVIHALGEKTFVAQASLHKGGTWKGTEQNLRRGWSPVFCYRDGSQASEELVQMGAVPVDSCALSDMDALQAPWEKLF